MRTILLILILLITSNILKSQVKNTISINNIEYEVIVDTITHKIRSCEIIVFCSYSM